MKRKSKAIRKDYSKLENEYTNLAYYGILMKDGRARIDTKRYRKFFEVPDSKIEHRGSVYYIPTKIHRKDYYCNRFFDLTVALKEQWLNEYSKLLKDIKTPKEIEDDVRTGGLMDGVLEYDEACTNAMICGMQREGEYRYIIKTIHAQFFQLMMSQIDALSLKVIVENGYKNNKFSRAEFDAFMQGKQKKGNSISFYDYKFYYAYDKGYWVWNFLKHNSTKSYDQLKSKYPDLINDPNGEYENGNMAISVLNLDENLILKTLDELPLFFDEMCQRGFNENPKDARWDYDDYFIQNAQDQIDLIENPLGLPDWL